MQRSNFNAYRKKSAQGAVFGYRSGWRFSEIATLAWSQVDLSNGIVRLETGETKNDEGRVLYFDDELKEVFQKQWDERGRKTKLLPYVFSNEHGTDRIKDIRGSWAKACDMQR